MKISADFFNSEYGAILNLLNAPPAANVERIKLLSFFWHIEALISNAAGSGDDWVPFSANLKKLEKDAKIGPDLHRAFLAVGDLRNAMSHLKNEPAANEVIAEKSRAVVEAWRPVNVHGASFFNSLASRIATELRLPVKPDNWGGADFQELFGALFAALIYAIAVNQFRDENARDFPLGLREYRFELTAG